MVTDLVKRLQAKPVVHGGVLLTPDEIREILTALEAKPKRGRPRKVPHETHRASQTAV